LISWKISQTDIPFMRLCHAKKPSLTLPASCLRKIKAICNEGIRIQIFNKAFLISFMNWAVEKNGKYIVRNRDTGNQKVF
jgi:hypothetical protein